MYYNDEGMYRMLNSPEWMIGKFGTGHALDMLPTQVTIDEDVHNVLMGLGPIQGAGLPQAVTMCGVQVAEGAEPASGRTTCSQCGLLAAYGVIALG